MFRLLLVSPRATVRRICLTVVSKPLIVVALVLATTATLVACGDGTGTQPGPGGRSADVETGDEDDMAQVALDFVNAWYATDMERLRSILDDDAEILGGQSLLPEFRLWKDSPRERLCTGELPEYRDLLCGRVEVGGLSDVCRVCEDPSPAESLNGYGRKCEVNIRYAERLQGEESWDDDWPYLACVYVQMKGDVALVTYASFFPACQPECTEAE